jgi:hypothetical protein
MRLTLTTQLPRLSPELPYDTEVEELRIFHIPYCTLERLCLRFGGDGRYVKYTPTQGSMIALTNRHHLSK